MDAAKRRGSYSQIIPLPSFSPAPSPWWWRLRRSWHAPPPPPPCGLAPRAAAARAPKRQMELLEV